MVDINWGFRGHRKAVLISCMYGCPPLIRGPVFVGSRIFLSILECQKFCFWFWNYWWMLVYCVPHILSPYIPKEKQRILSLCKIPSYKYSMQHHLRMRTLNRWHLIGLKSKNDDKVLTCLIILYIHYMSVIGLHGFEDRHN